MKKIDLGQTISILANFGVIAGIVFLAVEIGQNQRALDEQNMLTSLSGRDSAFSMMGSFRRLRMENPELDRVWRDGVADQIENGEDMGQFELLCEERIFIASTLHNRFMALEDLPAAQNQVNGLRRLNEQSDTFNRCWQRIKEIALEGGQDRFVAAIDLAAGRD